LHYEFLGLGEQYAASLLMVVLSPGHSDITTILPWSSIATGNKFDRAEKIQNCSDDWQR